MYGNYILLFSNLVITTPVSKDKLNINVRMGAISWCSSLRILGEISSGPDALFGESPCRSLSTIDIYLVYHLHLDISKRMVKGSLYLETENA